MAADRVAHPFAAGTVTGIAAWLTGYLATFVLATDAVREALTGTELEVVVAAATDWQLAGWLFFNAHGVAIRSAETPITVGESTVTLVAESGVTPLYAVPFLTLVASGAVLAWHYREPVETKTDAAILGATVSVGYLGCMGIGLLAFGVSLEGSTLRPDLLTGVVLGLASPIAFGSLGGLVSFLIASRAAVTADE
ncbi:hypothetical protein D8Y22_17790 [Salinadaptatus halalkaliphilus]|uniref:DUF7978 domain-containing protein n=1 Tax=Salinadaptatus halalkaliphilus TaxID=2419781 RepID=A0A4S3THZ7_9EURY|nr:hypothetical protein [Salinadaptatus halalkaliphilus]THE63664.1 hypothetical protein D8Y22_17790 [Salinadaptatus halalkaliphilus]